MMTLFKEGKVGMIINGPWEVANIESDPKFGGFENLGISAVPAGSAEAGAPVGGHNYVVYSGMDDAKAEAAVAFVKFMSSPESEAFIAEELGLLPGNADSYDLISDNEKVAAWKSALDVARPRPWIPEGGLFFAPLDEMATKVLVQGQDPKAALDAAAKAFKTDVVPDYSE
jgi:arabinogalactan oligomer/maltooligosaccharide transport system substrate-binding protein